MSCIALHKLVDMIFGITQKPLYCIIKVGQVSPEIVLLPEKQPFQVPFGFERKS